MVTKCYLVGSAYPTVKYQVREQLLQILENNALWYLFSLSGKMFHTTPENEAQHARGLPVQMVPSHGCIHLKPVDRDIITAYGAFKPKTIFIVHEYSERFTK